MRRIAAVLSLALTAAFVAWVVLERGQGGDEPGARRGARDRAVPAETAPVTRGVIEGRRTFTPGIEKAADQPGASQAVDLRPRPGDPDRAAALVARRQLGFGNQGLAGSRPGLVAALEDLGRDALLTQPGRRPLAQLQAALADHHGGLPGELGGPVADLGGGAAQGRGNQPRIGGEILVEADIDQRRTLRRSEQTDELIGGNRIWRRHLASPSQVRVERDTLAFRLVGRSRSPLPK